MINRSVLPCAEVYIIEGFGLNTEILFNWLAAQCIWTEYRSNAKPCPAYNTGRRLNCTMGLDYEFSGKVHKAVSMDKAVKKLLDRVNQTFGYSLNSAYLNYYPDASVGLAYHTDREPCLVEGSPVVSLSLGANRTFWFKSNSDGSEVGFELKDGDLVIMADKSQTNYKHGLKRECGNGARISITFRQMKV